MKKIFIISLLSLLLANTMGYYLLYSLDYLAIKHEMAEMIKELSGSETVTLSFPEKNSKANSTEVSYTSDDELIYQGKMYDIISQSINQGIISYKCYSDTRETQLSENLTRNMNSDQEHPSQKNKNKSTNKISIKDFNHQTQSLIYFAPVYSATETYLSPCYLSEGMLMSIAHPPPGLLQS